MALDMQAAKKRLEQILKYLQVFFYLAAVFLWFKDNFSAFKRIRVSYLFPLVALLILFLIRLYLKSGKKKFNLSLRPNKVVIAIIVLLVIASLVRIPFLLNHFGLMDGDEAIPALAGKHISEGKVPALFYYGAMFQGSLPQHFYALMFKLFGYSALMAKITAFMAFILFLCFQFILLSKMFSYRFAVAVCSFYILPISNLIRTSFDIGSGFPFVLLMGILIFYFTYLIYDRDKQIYLPALGFLMGLAFWTHQITVSIILTSLIFIAFKFRLQWRKYFTLALYACIGAFPLLLNEVYYKFPLLKFLFVYGTETTNPNKLQSTRDITLSLISHEANFLNYLYIMLIFLGLLSIPYLSLKKKKILPANIYMVFSVLFFLIYFFSGFSNTTVPRYMFPFYLALPVVLSSFLYLMRARIKYILIPALFLMVFFLSEARTSYSLFRTVKEDHAQLSDIIFNMENSKQKFWMGDYWTAYLVTSLTGEDIIVASYTVARYRPYQLLYYNESQKTNWVFYGEEQKSRAKKLVNVIQKLGIRAKIKEFEKGWLIRDIEGNLYPSFFVMQNLPEKAPELILDRIEESKGYLFLYFRTRETLKHFGFRVNASIEEFSSAVKHMTVEEGETRLKIPYPRKKTLRIDYYVDFKGMTLSSTHRRFSYTLSSQALRTKRKRIAFLSGFGPRIDLLGERYILCGKKVRIEINRPLGKKTKMRLDLYSHFDFKDWSWYGDYTQNVAYFLNQKFIGERELHDGENTLTLDFKKVLEKKKNNILEFRFKYCLPPRFYDSWKTSALLREIEIE